MIQIDGPDWLVVIQIWLVVIQMLRSKSGADWLVLIQSLDSGPESKFSEIPVEIEKLFPD